GDRPSRPAAREMGGRWPASLQSTRRVGARHTARGTVAQDRRSGLILRSRAVATQAGRAVCPIDRRGCAASAQSGVAAVSPSQECPRGLGDVLGLLADQERRRTIAEVGVHAAEPGPHRVVILLCTEDLDDLERVLESRGSLSTRNILTSYPPTDGFGVSDACNRGDQPLAEQVLQCSCGGCDGLARDARMHLALSVCNGFGHSCLGKAYHKTHQ